MLFPIIKVKDGRSGHEHVLGTNSHDSIYVDDETGGLQFLNLQSMAGTKIYDGQSEYGFVGKREDWNPYVSVEFVTFDELLEIYKENIAMSCEQERKTRDMFKKFIAAEREKHNLDSDEGEVRHTGGQSRY